MSSARKHPSKVLEVYENAIEKVGDTSKSGSSS